MSKRSSFDLSVYKRKRYAEIKNNPEMYEREKEKEKLRYLKKKEKGQVIPIDEKSPRDQRQQRKKWRESSKKYRENKKDKINETKLPEIVLIQNQEDISPKKTQNTVTVDPLNATATKIRRIRYMEQKRRRTLINIIQDLKKENRNLKNKLRQLEMKIQNPKKTVKQGRVMKNIKSAQVTRIRTTLPILIKKFMEQDSNSTIIPGKKQYITRNKVQKQKRRLLLPLKQLHKKFMSEHNIPVSYAFFCRHRPFWVTFPTKTLRETCACITHTNIDLIVLCLNKAGIIKETNYEQLLESLCCSQYQDQCLKRECILCKNKTLHYNEFPNDQNLCLSQWVRSKQTIKTKKGLKTQYVTSKNTNEITPHQAIEKLDCQLPSFFKHAYLINAQFNTAKFKKNNLIVTEAYIHIDFSENFGLKYGKEVQSLHFGASRKEICLHTGVIYTYDFHRSAIGTTCACTVSQCLRHDAAAIWAHLVPMIKLAIEINPFIDTIHFQSDSPSSQYRNKYIFHMISVLHNDFPQLKAITWNYSEAGHGKGAPDGIGGVLKRTADNIIIYGQDVSTFDQFIDIIKQNVENITLMTVTEDEVVAKEAMLPKNLKPFKGTLNVHQVLWKQGQYNLVYRKASCFDCEYICIHDKHLGFSNVVNYNIQNDDGRPGPSTSDSAYYVAPLARTSKALSNITNTSTNLNVVSTTPKKIVILSNKKVIVKK